MPDAIILFGSSSKGEDIKESDIDLYLQSEEKKISPDKFEKKLKRRIKKKQRKMKSKKIYYII